MRTQADRPADIIAIRSFKINAIERFVGEREPKFIRLRNSPIQRLIGSGDDCVVAITHTHKAIIEFHIARTDAK